MSSNLNLRSPTRLTVIGIGATLVLTAAVVAVLFWFGGGARAVSDNAALIGGLIALGGVFTTQLVNISLEDLRAERARETEQHQRNRELEVAQQRSQDEALQTYLDQMGELLLNEDRPLYRSTASDSRASLARSRTLTVLARLDGARKGYVVRFLYEAALISRRQVIVDLLGADLSGADLRSADLRDANLSGANLSGADLMRVNLSGASLVATRFHHSDLSDAYLSGTDLSDADLRDARLRGAYLADADLHGADVSNVGLERQAASLEGAIMPNGQKYEDWIKDKEGRGEEGENPDLS